MIKKPARHRLHRTLGIIIVPLLLLSALTGFFRANSKWFWEDGYKKKKHPAAFRITSPLITVAEAAHTIDSLGGKTNAFEQVRLKQEAGKLFYELSSGKNKFLLDAENGQLVSPLEPALALAIAKEYIYDSASSGTCTLIPDYVTRKEKEVRPVYEVKFANQVNSRIYLDINSGEIVEDVDDNRSFGMWMVKLHDYDFFNAKRSITSVVGAGIVILSLTGIWIYRRKKKKRKLKQHFMRKVVKV